MITALNTLNTTRLMVLPHKVRPVFSASILLLLPLGSVKVLAQTPIISPLERCYLEQMNTSANTTTIANIQKLCSELAVTPTPNNDSNDLAEVQAPASDSLLLRRIFREEAVISNSIGLLPHKRNYVLPVTYSKNPNHEPYDIAFGDAVQENDLDHTEIKFQISLKFPIVSELFLAQDQLAFGFTSQSYWQAYNSDLSSPFRETNYEPEVFYSAPLNWRPLNVDSTLFSIGFAHQSNGQGGTLSRSWNRINADFVWEKGNFVFGMRSWWRVTNDKNLDPSLAFGDDNPDLEDYLGKFEFNTLYRTSSHELGIMVRQSFESGSKNYLQMDWTFPLWGQIRGYAQYVNGYGESLIDYNAKIERFGIGILLSDLL